VDYLLKPIEIQNFQQTIEKIKDKLKHDEKHVFDAKALLKFSNNAYGLYKPVIIKNNNAIELVSSKDIFFTEAFYSLRE